MTTLEHSAPYPDLRIVAMDALHPHEQYDPQRAEPLLETLRQAEWLTNPPIAAPMDADGEHFVLLDGANRYHCFQQLGYPHLLVQIVSYESAFVELDVWQHVVSHWEPQAFLQHLRAIEDIHLRPQNADNTPEQPLARFLLHTEPAEAWILHAPQQTIAAQNAALRRVVYTYQQYATLHRTALTTPAEVWRLYADAVALVHFPPYEPQDIINAARNCAYLPPGISRHIIHGRALKLNYPLARLQDDQTQLQEKNAHLQQWLQRKIEQRAVRYYAESTYQFDE